MVDGSLLKPIAKNGNSTNMSEEKTNTVREGKIKHPILMEQNQYISLPGQIKNSILEDILNGELKPGEKITEEVYAKKLKVSRAPVREAILMLITEGVAHKIENRGTFLYEHNLEEILDLYAFKRYIEVRALEKVEDNEDLTDILDKMEYHAQQMVIDLDDLNHISQHNYLYHFELVKAANSRVLTNMYPSYYVSINFIQHESYMKHQSREKVLRKALDQHFSIVEHLRNRNFDRAKKVFIQHHKEATELIFSNYVNNMWMGRKRRGSNFNFNLKTSQADYKKHPVVLNAGAFFFAISTKKIIKPFLNCYKIAVLSC